MRKIAAIFAAFLLPLISGAQNLSDLIISEAMPVNSSSVTDSYGEHTPWIELFNTSQGTVNFAGCFLTDDLSDLTKCQIPKGDMATRLGPRQVTLLFASGDASQGSFFLNFRLVKGASVYLVSNDGRTVIDSITIPEDLPDSCSIAKFPTDNKEMLFDDVHATAPSPRSVNGKHNQKTRAQIIKETDPRGWTLSIIAVSVVFAALLILFLLYSLSGGIFTGKFKRKKQKHSPADEGTAAAIAMALDCYASDDDTVAAVAMALHLYRDGGVHDLEPGFITIRPTGGSAWNDKSQTFRKKVNVI